MSDDFDARAAWERIERRLRGPAPPSTARCLPPVEELDEFKVTAEDREQYEYEFEERVSVYVYEGMPWRCISKEINPTCCAHHLVLLELGTVDFWKYMRAWPFVLGVVRALAPRLVGYCTRCESVGHVVERCPFSIGDADVMKVARLRRERRAGREAAA
jgi:hypothetical protein